MTTLILLWLLKIISAEVITTDLNGVTIYSEELGQAQLYHDTWNIILGLGNDDIDDRLGCRRLIPHNQTNVDFNDGLQSI